MLDSRAMNSSSEMYVLLLYALTSLLNCLILMNSSINIDVQTSNPQLNIKIKI